MSKFKDVLIERNEKGLTWDYPVPILRNHDSAQVIGEAWIYEDDGRYFADLEPLDINPNGLYPSIGYRDGVIYNLGLCDNPNEDPLIKPLIFHP